MDEKQGKIFSWYPRVLVVGSGGIKSLKILGFLTLLEDEGFLKNVDTFCGVSTGSIILLLLISGYSIRDIVRESSILNSITRGKEITSIESVKKRLRQLISDKFGKTPTLLELFQITKKSFITVAFNNTDEKIVFFDIENYPNISCIDAVIFSINVPFISNQIIYEEKNYVDGTLANPYPLDYFDDSKTNILGIYVKSRKEQKLIPILKFGEIKMIKLSPKAESLFNYFNQIVSLLIDQRRNLIIEGLSDKCKNVCLFIDEKGKRRDNFLISSDKEERKRSNFLISIDEKATMLVEGYNEGRIFLDSLGKEEEKEIQKSKYNYSQNFLK